MSTTFQPDGRPTLIGSLPMDDHQAAVKVVMEHTPDIPLWVQLPVYPEEGMMTQFLNGLPGLTTVGNRTFVDYQVADFDTQILHFYEDYLAVTEGGQDITESRFALSRKTATGFVEFIRYLDAGNKSPVALKGQVTGPITQAVGLVDQNGQAVFYNDQMRDVVVKQLAMNAAYQIKVLKQFSPNVFLFFDEPALTGFGSSGFISITREAVEACFDEVIGAVHAEGGMAGVHVCANAEWPLILDSQADVVSFDAYAYFDRFILFKDSIDRFVQRGGILAWGIVPTLDADALAQETTESLVAKWKAQAAQIEAIGIDPQKIRSQTLITPSCGTGSLSYVLAIRALQLTADVSRTIRK